MFDIWKILELNLSEEKKEEIKTYFNQIDTKIIEEFDCVEKLNGFKKGRLSFLGEQFENINDKILSEESFELLKIIEWFVMAFEMLTKEHKESKYKTVMIFLCWESLDLISSILSNSLMWNFISANGLIRNLSERLLYIKIILKNPSENANIFHSYYNNYLEEIFDWDIEKKKWWFWFKGIEEFKDKWLYWLMKDFDIPDFNYYSKYTHSSFWNWTNVGYFTHNIQLNWLNKEWLFLTTHYKIYLDVTKLVLDLIFSIDPYYKLDFIEYISFLWVIANEKAEYYKVFPDPNDEKYKDMIKNRKIK